MRKIIPITIIMIFISLIACNKTEIIENNNTDNPGSSDPILVTIDTTKKFNGFVEIYPCLDGTTVYNGVYYKGSLMPFPAQYDVKNGIGQALNNALTLTSGEYNLIFWGYPNYSNYFTPDSYVTPPGLRLGANLNTLYYSLTPAGTVSTDTLYLPVYDMAVGTQVLNIDAQTISTNLRRVTSGLNVIINNSDSTAFSNAIDSMWMYVGGISYQINFATGNPLSGTYKTVSKGLSPTTGRQTFTSDSTYLFPSYPAPPIQLFVKLNTGTVKTFQSNMNKQLSAGTFTTLYITLNGILLSKSSSGIITINSWVEQTDSITFPIL